MTTSHEQSRLIEPVDELQAYETIIGLRLEQIRVWTALPEERTDWALEAILDELRTAALAVRRLRGEEDLPF